MFGPAVAFSTVSDSVPEQYDLDESVNGNDGKSWGKYSDSEGFASAREFRLKRKCNQVDFEVYVGRFSKDTITRDDFEALFQKWVRDKTPGYCALPENE